MENRKPSGRQKTVSDEIYYLKVESFESNVSAGVRNLSLCQNMIPLKDFIYEFRVGLEVKAKCVYPESNEGDHLLLNIIVDKGEEWFTKTLADVQHKDADSSPKYVKCGGGLAPVFDEPLAIGGMSRHRKVDPWAAIVAVPQIVVSEFQSALSRNTALYISLSVHRIGRERLIKHVRFTTVGPDDA